MIHQICEAYGWSFEDAMRMTMPQIIMLGHASWVSHERMEKRIEARRKSDKKQQSTAYIDPGPVYHGKRLEEMNTDELMSYYGGFTFD